MTSLMKFFMSFGLPRVLERRYITPAQRQLVTKRRLAVLMAAFGVVAVSLVLDRLVYWLLAGVDVKELESEDWYQVIRQVGYVPLWILIAGLIYLLDRAAARATIRDSGPTIVWPARPVHHRAGLVALSVVLAGLSADLVKYLVGRSRPLSPEQAQELTERFAESSGRVFHAGYTYWGGGMWQDLGWTGGFPKLTEQLGDGFFSGHTATAFGGMVMLALLYRPIRVPALILAFACGWSRLAAQAHSLSDVVAGAMVGAVVAWTLYRCGEGVRNMPYDAAL